MKRTPLAVAAAFICAALAGLAAGALVAQLLTFVFVTPAAAAQQPLELPALDDVGVAWLGACESDNRPHLEGYFDGEHQWLLSTWNLAVREQGWDYLAGVTANHHPQQTQREVTKAWWSSSTHAGPHTQWPNCFDDALRSMGYPSPCIGRNVYGCGTTWQQPAGSALPAAAPVPNFAG